MKPGDKWHKIRGHINLFSMICLTTNKSRKMTVTENGQFQKEKSFSGLITHAQYVTLKSGQRRRIFQILGVGVSNSEAHISQQRTRCRRMR
jgi:hypothetical protein